MDTPPPTAAGPAAGWPLSARISVIAVSMMLVVLLGLFAFQMAKGGPFASQNLAGSQSALVGQQQRKLSVATAQDTGWQALPLASGWRATGDGARYRIHHGICYLQVHVIDEDGIWAANTQFATLPPAAVPAWNLGFVGIRAGLPFGEVGVFNDGQILVVAPSTAAGGDLTVSAAFPTGH